MGLAASGTTTVTFENVRVPNANVLGQIGLGFLTAMKILDKGRLFLGAAALGMAKEAYDMAVNHATQRQQFGKPIADFQAIQLKLADIATQLQAARLMTYWAASRADAGQRVDMEAGMAKYFASETAITASLEAMRIHGGYGYSTEFVVERLYRDAPLMAIGEGTNDIMRTVIAKALVSGSGVVG